MVRAAAQACSRPVPVWSLLSFCLPSLLKLPALDTIFSRLPSNSILSWFHLDKNAAGGRRGPEVINLHQALGTPCPRLPARGQSLSHCPWGLSLRCLWLRLRPPVPTPAGTLSLPPLQGCSTLAGRGNSTGREQTL